MPEPLRIAFLGCGFITRVHSRHLRSLGTDIVCSYASRDRAKADGLLPAIWRHRQLSATTRRRSRIRGRRRGRRRAAALSSRPDAAGARGRQARARREAGVPADGGLPHGARGARPRRRVVLVGENDHYKPLAVRCGSCSPRARSARWCSPTSRRIAKRLKTADDWRNDEAMAGGDAFFEEGIHWLHLAGSLGPTNHDAFRATGRRSRDEGPDTGARRA